MNLTQGEKKLILVLRDIMHESDLRDYDLDDELAKVFEESDEVKDARQLAEQASEPIQSEMADLIISTLSSRRNVGRNVLGEEDHDATFSNLADNIELKMAKWRSKYPI